MRWPEEIREAEFPELTAEPKVGDKEVKMARSLIEGMSEPFKPEGFKDTYREAVMELAQAKLEGEEVAIPEAEEPAPKKRSKSRAS